MMNSDCEGMRGVISVSGDCEWGYSSKISVGRSFYTWAAWPLFCMLENRYVGGLMITCPLMNGKEFFYFLFLIKKINCN